MGQEFGPLERTRTNGIGPSARVGIVLALLLVAAAIAKPWGIPEVAVSHSTESPTAAVVAGRTTGPPEAQLDPICPSPDGWQIVVDDVEFGKLVRTWLLPTAFYASALEPPALARTDVTTFVSNSVRQLAFCAPPREDGSAPSWSGELWYEADLSGTDARQLVGSLASDRGDFGAPVHLAGGVTAWPAGLYLLEATVYPATSPLWVPVILAAPPNA